MSDKFPVAWIGAIVILVATAALALAGKLDNVTAFIFGSVAILLFILGSREKYKISFLEAVKILEKELTQMQKDGILETGDMKFSSEGDATWDENENIFLYDVIFEVTNEKSTTYYMGRVSIYGSLLGMTTISSGSQTIMKANRKINKVQFKHPAIPDPKKDVPKEVKER